MLKITFLGTGTSQGIPVVGSNHPVCKSTDIKDKRLRSSILIQSKSSNFVIDLFNAEFTILLNSQCFIF